MSLLSTLLVLIARTNALDHVEKMPRMQPRKIIIRNGPIAIELTTFRMLYDGFLYQHIAQIRQPSFFTGTFILILHLLTQQFQPLRGTDTLRNPLHIIGAHPVTEKASAPIYQQLADMHLSYSLTA
jgi:hypothetical protein